MRKGLGEKAINFVINLSHSGIESERCIHFGEELSVMILSFGRLNLDCFLIIEKPKHLLRQINFLTFDCICLRLIIA